MKYIKAISENFPFQRGGIFDKEQLYVQEQLNGKPYCTVLGNWCIYKENIIAEADTIEELCDKFVVVCENNHKDIYGNIDGTLIDMVKNKIYMKELYGAIWTKNGLIYVAKMNNDGVFELL